MKSIALKILPLAVVAAAMAGCGSTPKQTALTEYPAVTVKSDNVYEWDSNISYAMNIAKMAQGAGIGFGVEDEENPMEASNNRTGSGGKVLSGVSGFLTGGFLGTAAAVNTEGAINEGRSWRTTLVDFIPVADMPNLNTPESFLYVRKLIGNRIKEALTKSVPDLDWKGEFMFTKANYHHPTAVFFNTKECGDAYSLLKDDASRVTTWGFDLSKRVIESEQAKGFSSFCGIGLNTVIVGTIATNSTSHYIVVTDIGSSASDTYFGVKLNQNYSGYVLNPDSFKFEVYGEMRKGNWNNPYPFVSHKGQQHLFDKNDKGHKLQF